MKFAKRLTAFLIMLVMLITSVPMDGFTSMTAYADEVTKLTVTGDVVNIRSGAGTSYSKVTTVTRSTVLVSQGTAKDSSGKVWHKVTVNGSTGYIISTYVSASTTSGSAQTLTVTGTNVYVRKGAGTSYSYITTVKKGATYTVQGSAKDSSGNTWYKISINNTTGYIIGTYVKVSGGTTSTTTTTTQGSASTTTAAKKQKLTVTGDIVNVRKGAGTSYAKVTTVKRNATFDVQGSSKDSSGTTWYKISVNGTTGYIISTYVKVSTVTTATTTTTTAATTTTTTEQNLITAPSSTTTESTTVSTTGSAADTTASTTTTTTAAPTTAATTYNGTTYAVNVAVVLSSGVNMRSGAGDSYSLLGSIGKGSTIVILSNRTDSSGNLWYRASCGLLNGYIKATDLADATVSPATTTTTTASSAATTVPQKGTTTSSQPIITLVTSSSQNGGVVLTTNDISESVTTNANSSTDTRYVTYGTVDCGTRLHVRSGPGTEYNSLGTVNHGVQVIILGTSGDWYKIEYVGSSSGYGYVSKEFVTNVKTGSITISIGFGKAYYYVNQGFSVDVSINLNGYTVGYSSEDSAAAPVTSEGKVTGNKPGVYTITATVGAAKATTEVVVLKSANTDVEPMTISAEGTEFIANWEGGGTPLGDTVVFYPYQDVSGYWTVGYGHAVTSTASKSWTREEAISHFNDDITALLGEGHEMTDEKPYLTLEEATNLLNADLNDGPYVKAVSDWAVRNGVVLRQNQFDALVSFCYNLGPAYWTSDTYYFYLKSAIIAYRSGDDAIPEQIIDGFTRYIKSGGVNLKGLWWRRRNEAEMFLEGDYAIDRDNKFTLPNITWG